jgi:8-oxo-dGTP diphosphatase
VHSNPFTRPCPVLTIHTIIFTLHDNLLQVLLIQRREEPFLGMWALPEGYVCFDESLESAALRILKEETGINEAYLEQLYTFGDPIRDPRGRVVTIAYFALISMDALRKQGELNTQQAYWFPLDNLPLLAFDHAKIVEYASCRLRYKLEYSAIVFELLPEEFTLSELQTTYELVLGEKLDKRNFRRRILESNIIDLIDHMRTGEGRPAHLYRYHAQTQALVKARRLFP